ncbi:MAG TPA: nuclear transport factor 2 family protein [Thermoleophilaceae bacterium]|nr:nuclear transport factor 2 family protein [Thermoleophilaceae bacterium]
MADDHLELCQLAYARFSAGDVVGLLELFHPDVEVYVAPPNFESGTYRGHDAYRRLLERWGASWEEMRIGVGAIEAAGDWALASVEYAGTVTGSDIEVRQPSWELSLWRDGQCHRYEVYWDRDQGLAAFASHRGAEDAEGAAQR